MKFKFLILKDVSIFLYFLNHLFNNCLNLFCWLSLKVIKDKNKYLLTNVLIISNTYSLRGTYIILNM